jgi:MYXO-CTERM domain-containing protein
MVSVVGVPARGGERVTSEPKLDPAGVMRFGARPGTRTAVDDAAFSLLMDSGTVFTIQNGTEPYRPTDMIYTGPANNDTGTPATPAPGAALLAAVGLSLIGFIRRRVGPSEASP